MHLRKSFVTFGSWVLISRVLGLLRDVLMAQALGTGIMSDSFFAALKLPGFFQVVFGEGSAGASFVPLYVNIMEKEGPHAAHLFAGRILGGSLVVIGLLCGVMVLVAPQIMGVLAPGFRHHPLQFALVVSLARLMLPYFVFMVLSTLLMGMLNTAGKFSASSASPLFFNLTLITLALFFWKTHALPTSAQVVFFAWGVLVSGVLQVGFLVLACYRARVVPSFVWPRFDEKIRLFFRRLTPVVFSSSITRLNGLVSSAFASTLGVGVVSYLYYMSRFSLLFVGLVGVTLSVVSLPSLARLIQTNQKQESRHLLNQALIIGFTLACPAMVALYMIPVPLLEALLKRGAFDATSVSATASLLRIAALGVPAFVLNKVVSSVFFAHGDVRTPFLSSLLAVGINLTVVLTLISSLRQEALALASSLAGWGGFIFLMLRGYQKRFILLESRTILSALKICLASFLMGVGLFYVSLWLPSALPGEAFIDRLLRLAALTTVGVLLFSMGGALLNIRDVLRYIGKGR